MNESLAVDLTIGFLQLKQKLCEMSSSASSPLIQNLTHEIDQLLPILNKTIKKGQPVNENHEDAILNQLKRLNQQISEMSASEPTTSASTSNALASGLKKLNEKIDKWSKSQEPSAAIAASESTPFVNRFTHVADMNFDEVQRFHERHFAKPSVRELSDLTDFECLCIQSYARRGKQTVPQLARNYRISEGLVTCIQRGSVRQEVLRNRDITTWFQPPV